MKYASRLNMILASTGIAASALALSTAIGFAQVPDTCVTGVEPPPP
jgi:hypothetical protein